MNNYYEYIADKETDPQWKAIYAQQAKKQNAKARANKLKNDPKEAAARVREMLVDRPARLRAEAEKAREEAEANAQSKSEDSKDSTKVTKKKTKKKVSKKSAKESNTNKE